MNKLISDQEDELFQRWKGSRNNLVADGVVDETSFLASPIRLLFILKEVNDQEEGGWDLREFLRQGGRPATWNNLARWVSGIYRLPQIASWDKVKNVTSIDRQQALRPISAINLKKTPGRYSADPKEIARFAYEDSELIGAQVALYMPKLVICCGTGDIYKQVTDPRNEKKWQTTSRGIPYYFNEHKAAVLSYSHTGARVPPQVLYYCLLDSISEINSLG